MANYELTVTRNDVVTRLPLHYLLTETNADKVVLELNFPIGTHVTVPADMNAKVDDADGVKPELIGAYGWPVLTEQFTYPPFVKIFSGHEKVGISGKTFDCRYGSITVAGMKITQWFSDDVPGGLVKSELVGVANPQKKIKTGQTGWTKH